MSVHGSVGALLFLMTTVLILSTAQTQYGEGIDTSNPLDIGYLKRK